MCDNKIDIKKIISLVTNPVIKRWKVENKVGKIDLIGLWLFHN